MKINQCVSTCNCKPGHLVSRDVLIAIYIFPFMLLNGLTAYAFGLSFYFLAYSCLIAIYLRCLVVILEGRHLW